MIEIGEVIVVEGDSDRVQVLRAVRADVLVTGGTRIRKEVFTRLSRVAAGRGIIILTDPDFAGGQIRRQIAARFPQCKHAFLPRAAATVDGDVGVENADPLLIAEVLAKVRSHATLPEPVFTWDDMAQNGLTGAPQSAARRERLGAILRIGYGNGKTFFARLNALQVTRSEWESALTQLKEDDQ